MSQQSFANLADPIDAPVRQGASGVGELVEFPKFPRSPLRYPGGKNRAVKAIYRLIPPNEERLFSPFLGGGSIELACTSKMEVYGADIFEPLAAFWRVLLRDPEELANRVSVWLHKLTRTQFYALQKRFVTLDDEVERAAQFFVLNRSSFSGTTLSGGMSPDHPRFTPSAIERIRNFRAERFRVEHADYRVSIPRHADAFLYLDPPYLTKQGLYGVKGSTHRAFDHKTLAEMMRERDRWIMSYNECGEVRELYRGYRIRPIEWVYGMTKDKQSKEVLIFSHDVPIAA